ncbi:MAG: hypothetical protein NC397_05010 [Clostridium sp.]|nr:hypothetical protein [Clostridium sp.]
MKFSFNMTAEDFYIGWKYKLKKNNRNNASGILLLPVLILFFILMVYTKEFFTLSYIILVVLFMLVNHALQKKSIKSQFYSSPVLTGEQTIVLYDEGIELINSYEKMFVPWKGIFSIKQDSKNLIIMPTFRKGIFVINKERYSGSDLDNMIFALQQNVKIEEGKK